MHKLIIFICVNLRNLRIDIFIRRLRRFTQIEDKAQELYCYRQGPHIT